MPIYTVRCDCGRAEDIFRRLAEIEDLPECCGKRMERVMCAPLVMGDIQPYRSMVTGEMIESRSKHRAHLQQHRLVEVGNETKYLKPKPLAPPPGLTETLVTVANEKLRSS